MHDAQGWTAIARVASEQIGLIARLKDNNE